LGICEISRSSEGTDDLVSDVAGGVELSGVCSR
jgi:hypothetical protein